VSDDEEEEEDKIKEDKEEGKVEEVRGRLATEL
jgi:hypothetical protein